MLINSTSSNASKPLGRPSEQPGAPAGAGAEGGAKHNDRLVSGYRKGGNVGIRQILHPLGLIGLLTRF